MDLNGNISPEIRSLSPEVMLSAAELAEIWARRAYDLAEEPPAPATGEMQDLLVFQLENERYGIPVIQVQEIYPLDQITPVPRTPNFVVGVFSARGRIVSVVDLRSFLGLSPLAITNTTKIIVVANKNAPSTPMEIGLVVDEVEDAVTIFWEDIEAPLTTHSSAQAAYLEGITAGIIIVLNLNKLLNDSRLIVYEEVT